jgi:hypothetical protein
VASKESMSTIEIPPDKVEAYTDCSGREQNCQGQELRIVDGYRFSERIAKKKRKKENLFIQLRIRRPSEI